MRRLAAGYGLVDQSVTRRVIAEFARHQSPAESPAEVEQLTARELESVKLLAQVMSNAEIAATLVVETSTVKPHLARLPSKTGARDRVQAYHHGLA